MNDLLKRCNELFTVENGTLVRKTSVAPNALAGSIAGWFDEYWKVKVDRKQYLTHRIIFLMVNGHLPELIDHIDGDVNNNLPENLREATKSQNRWNSKPNRGSISGVKGVYLDGAKWKAMVNFKGVRYYLGMYSSIEEASEVVRNKYDELHGEYAAKLK